MTAYTSRLPVLAALLSLPLITACDIDVNVGKESDSASESESASASESESETASESESETAPGSESDSETGSSTSSGGSEESSGSTGGSDESSSGSVGTSEGDDGDTGTPPGPGECSLIVQDCTGGDRCHPRAVDGDAVYGTVDCMETSPQARQEGDPCSVEGSGLSGVNNCDIGLFCANVDPETNEGVCAQFCSHDGLDVDCDNPLQTCVIVDGFFGICLQE